MGKPSIFSKDYQKKMRNRRRNTIILIIIVVAISIFFLFNSTIRKWAHTQTSSLRNNITSKNNKTVKNTNNKENNTNSTKDDAKKKQEVKKVQESSYDITLGDGTIVKVVYELNNDSKKFKSIQSSNNNINYNINPSGNAVVIFDDKKQSIIYVDISGKQQDISKTQYTASDGTVFNRETVLANNPNYIWTSTPKFMDDNTVAYISQLPWFNNTTNKYIWIININDYKNQYSIQNVTGTDIKFGDITDKGMGVTVDGKNMFIKSNGEVVQ